MYGLTAPTARKWLGHYRAGGEVALADGRKAPGDLLHFDTKELGCMVRPSHRVTGNRKDAIDGAG